MKEKLSFRRDLGWHERTLLLVATLTFSILLKLALISHVEGQLLFVSMFVVVVNAIYGGFSMGILAALVTSATHGILFFRPEFRHGAKEPALILEGISYLSIACLLAYFGGNLRVAHKRMRDAVEGRDSLMAMLAHDLRNPLAAIKLSAELLSRTSNKELGQNFRAVHSILISAESMEGLISSILDSERAKAGKLEVQLERVDLAKLIERVRTLMEPVAARKNVSLQVSGTNPDECLLIACDGRRMLQVFLNLIGNAIKFSPPGGNVRLNIEPKITGGRVVFTISDEGPGISKEDQARVFARGWQKDSNNAKGIGLGLWIVKSVLTSHTVDLELESQLGSGTKFRFELPLVREVSGSQSA